VINNQFYDYSDKAIYEVKVVRQPRRIVDFSDIENSWSILPTGQSGNPVRITKIKLNCTIQGKFRKMKMNKEIIQTSTKLILNPLKTKVLNLLEY
jgi:penicillin amidase